MKISFEIDELDFREAICEGWEERFGEKLKPEELRLVPTAIDVCCAMSVITDSVIDKVRYEK